MKRDRPENGIPVAHRTIGPDARDVIEKGDNPTADPDLRRITPYLADGYVAGWLPQVRMLLIAAGLTDVLMFPWAGPTLMTQATTRSKARSRGSVQSPVGQPT